jgi:hypothetical protein
MKHVEFISVFLLVFVLSGFIWTRYDVQTLVLRIAFAVGSAYGCYLGFSRVRKQAKFALSEKYRSPQKVREGKAPPAPKSIKSQIGDFIYEAFPKLPRRKKKEKDSGKVN